MIAIAVSLFAVAYCQSKGKHVLVLLGAGIFPALMFHSKNIAPWRCAPLPDMVGMSCMDAVASAAHDGVACGVWCATTMYTSHAQQF